MNNDESQRPEMTRAPGEPRGLATRLKIFMPLWCLSALYSVFQFVSLLTTDQILPDKQGFCYALIALELLRFGLCIGVMFLRRWACYGLIAVALIAAALSCVVVSSNLLIALCSLAFLVWLLSKNWKDFG